MRPIAIFLTVFVLLIIPFGVGSAAGASPFSVVVLTADQVHTAVDIETAFHQATGWGTHPGVVVLDGSRGPFRYDPAYGDDFDINIFYSDLILQGQNGAVIEGGGINFDGMVLENIIIEDLGMLCPADCIISWGGPHRNVTIQDNRLIATGFGIQVAETDGWLIHSNAIQTGGVAVDLIETNGITVQNNRLAGYIPVRLYHSFDCRVIHNTALGTWEGVLVTSLSNANWVIANIILSVQSAGISLESNTQDNQVHGNVVKCALGTDCLTVQALELVWEENNISGNRP